MPYQLPRYLQPPRIRGDHDNAHSALVTVTMAPPPAIPAATAPAAAHQPQSFVRGAVCGGLAAMAASACTQPIDLLKTRLQLSGELDGTKKRMPITTVVRHMLRTEGIRGFYCGLSASLMRQAIYSPARFGLFETMMAGRWLGFLSGGGGGSGVSSQSGALPPVSTLERLVSAMLSGAFGGLLSSPADLVMVRMQADGRLAPSLQRGYSGVMGGLRAVVDEGGVRGLFRGATPNVQRGMVTTATQFTAYSSFKTFVGLHLPQLGDGFAQHLTASLMAGVVVATCACPFDVMRSRMMNSAKATPSAATATAATATTTTTAAAASAAASAATNGAAAAPGPVNRVYAHAYKSTWECGVQTFRAEGVRGFYKGYLTYYLRVAPQVSLMFVFFEQIQKVYGQVVD